VRDIASQTPGASAARLLALVDQAANYGLTANRKIEARDLRWALEENGGRDRPQLERAEWTDLVIPETIQRDIQSIIRLLEDPARTRSLGLEVSTGLLLVGPPGTGKTLIANLIASQTNRSFYPLTAASVLGGGVGDSVKRVAAMFSRAKERNPSLVFIDEMHGLLPSNKRYLTQHDVQLVEQFLTKIGSLYPDNQVFLVGTTRPSRGHRFKGGSRRPLLRETSDSATQRRTSSAAPQSVSTRCSHAARLNPFRHR